MPFTKKFEIPPDEELTVKEINISYPYLKAGSLHLGKYCEKENNEFILCRNELKDPRKCLKEGKDVTNCAMRFFCNVKKYCSQEMEQFAQCLHKANSLAFAECKNTQAVFDKCVLDKMGLERPPFGWQAEIHIHHTDRPKPKEEITYYPDAAVKYVPQENVKLPEPKFGIRPNFPRV